MTFRERIKGWWNDLTTSISDSAEYAARAADKLKIAGQTVVVGQGGAAWDTTPPELYPFVYPSAGEVEAQKLAIRARRFQAGIATPNLPAMLQTAFGPEAETMLFTLNFVATVSEAISERIQIAGAGGSDEQTTLWAQSVLDGSRLNSKRGMWFLSAVCDREAFNLVDWDTDNRRPRWTPHKRYTAEELGGDGEGIQMAYPGDDFDQRPTSAAKRWTERWRDNRGLHEQRRITVYKDAQIIKFAQIDGKWRELERVIWTDDGTDAGKPIGIPVVHLKTPKMQPAALRAWGVQLGLDRTYLTMLSAGEVESLRILVAFGWEPKSTAISAGTIIGAPDKKPGDASLTPLESGTATGHIERMDKQVALMCDLTGVPLTMLQRSNQRAAEGTLQEEKEAFFARLDDYAETFAVCFADSFKKSRDIQNVFSEEKAPEGDAAIKWKPYRVTAAATP